MAKSSSFATFLIIGPTCFVLGILFTLLPYDYHVLWASPPEDAGPGHTLSDYMLLQENNLRFLHASPPLIARMLNIIVGVGLLGFFIKLYKPSEANLLFDGASLTLYVIGIIVYVANIVKGLRMVTANNYGSVEFVEGETVAGTGQVELGAKGGIGREDSLRVMAASNTILALVLIGVLILQAGQWYAERKEEDEMAEMDQKAAEKKARSGSSSSSAKKKQ